MVVEARVSGIPDLRAALLSIPDKLRRRALRLALAAGARVVRDEARRQTPVLSGENVILAAPYRKPGTVRDAISVRTSKLDRRRGDVGVFVNVKPAKRGARGAKMASDPFYWQWLEFGWTPATGPRGNAGKRSRRAKVRAGAARAIPGAGFLQAGAKRLDQALEVFKKRIGPAIEKLNRGLLP